MGRRKATAGYKSGDLRNGFVNFASEDVGVTGKGAMPTALRGHVSDMPTQSRGHGTRCLVHALSLSSGSSLNRTSPNRLPVES